MEISEYVNPTADIGRANDRRRFSPDDALTKLIFLYPSLRSRTHTFDRNAYRD